jgi:hypothetical protein
MKIKTYFVLLLLSAIQLSYCDNKITTREIREVLTSEKKIDKHTYDLADILSI